MDDISISKSWVIVCVGWLLLIGCGSIEPAATLVPTLALPVASMPPSPASTEVPATPTSFATDFPSWRTATLQDGQSYDFRQEITGLPTEGDMYYSAFSAKQGTACFWANNPDQVGGRDLGAWRLTALPQRPLPRERLSKQCLPIVRGHVYVYGIQDDERLAVFRVADTTPDAVTLDYILRQ
jgi:hypothetical protein